MTNQPSPAQQKLNVYRGRYDEASRIADALRARRFRLLETIIEEDLAGNDTVYNNRRLQQTEDELAIARIDESAAFEALRAEERRDHPTHQPREARR